MAFKNIVIFECSGDCKILLYVCVAKYGKERYCGRLIVHVVLYTGKQTDRVKKVTFRHFLLRPKRIYKAAKTKDIISKPKYWYK